MSQENNNIPAVAVEETTKIEARAYPIAEPKGSTLGYASINIDDKFAVNGLRIVMGKDDKPPFVAMPQTKDNRGEFRDICFPLNAELREQINDVVLKEYSVALDELVNEKASTVERLRAAATAAKGNVAPATEKGKEGKNKGGQER